MTRRRFWTIVGLMLLAFMIAMAVVAVAKVQLSLMLPAMIAGVFALFITDPHELAMMAIEWEDRRDRT